MSDQPSRIDAILEDRARFRERIRGLEAFLALDRPDPGQERAAAWAGELAERLGDLRRHLVRKFRREEGAGTIQELALEHPHRADELRRCIVEHRRLLDRLRALLADAQVYADGRSPRNRRLRREVAALLADLARHEREEAALLQRILVRDEGTPASGE